MKCPTICVCGRVVELEDMVPINDTLPDGGNLVCDECVCDACGGEGDCPDCYGDCSCHHCGAECMTCGGSGDCGDCGGNGYGGSE